MRLFSLFLLPLFCFLLALPALAQPAREVWQAEFILGDTPTPPTAHDPRWHPVRLPHALKTEDLAATGGWFRVRFQAKAIPAEPRL
jgi:hypothetical protein